MFSVEVSHAATFTAEEQESPEEGETLRKEERNSATIQKSIYHLKKTELNVLHKTKTRTEVMRRGSLVCVESATFGASKTESSSSEETVKSQESVSTDICSKQTLMRRPHNTRVTEKIRNM